MVDFGTPERNSTMTARPVAVTRHRVGMADVDLVQVFYARMFT